MDSHDEDDLYSDLPSFKYHETLDKLQSTNKTLLAKMAHLEAQIENLTKENSEYREKCSTLKTNISSIFKTAQNEIKRKDKRINELNREIITLKTSSFRLRRKRSQSDLLSGDNKEEFKKAKLETEKPSIKKSSDIESAASKSEELHNSYPSLIIKKESFGKNDETAKALRVPNINCPTVYSQRMFKKIYNAEPVNQVANDFDVNRVCGDSSPNISKEVQCEVNSVEQRSKLSDGNSLTSNVITNSSSTCSVSKPCIDKPDLINNRKTANLQNFERNNNSKVLTNLNSENQLDCVPNILDNKRKKDDRGNALDSVSIPSNLHDLSKNIPVKELRSIISNVMICHIEKGSQHFKKDALMLKDKTCMASNNMLSDASKCLDVKSNPQIGKTDTCSDNMISDAFGLKLLNRPNKTAFCPISGKWNSKVQKKEVSKELKLLQHPDHPPRGKHDGTDKIDIMESLFGSPLKWTENSGDDPKPIPNLNPPITAYEDSCSAQIENSKFHKLTSAEGSYLKTIKDNTLRKTEVLNEGTERATLPIKSGKDFQTSVPIKKSLEYPGIQKLEEAPTRLFEQVKNMKNQISNFSAFVNHSTIEEMDCQLPCLSVTVDQTSSQPAQLGRSSLTSPKYNDSILGQFDDTTQLISALARDHSKISPIHTPIKENKCEAVLLPENKSEVNIDHSVNKSDIKTNQSPMKFRKISPLAAQTTAKKRAQKKTILLDAPINILQPRKTPRNISDKNSPRKGTNISGELSVKKNALTGSSNKETNEVPSSPVKSVTLPTVPSLKVSSVSDEVIKRVQAIKRSENYWKHKHQGKVINNVPLDKSGIPEDSHNEEKCFSSLKNSRRSRSSSPKVENSLRNDSLSAKNLHRRCSSGKNDNSPRRCSSSVKKENSSRSSSSSMKKENSPRICSSSAKKENFPRSCPSSAKKINSRSRSSSAKKENSSRCRLSAKKENPRSCSSSARKENFPYRFRREERNHKSSSYHFKKPNSFYSRHQQNCHFRHSSVERRLLKDHRHANRMRSTPVRVIRRDEGQDPRIMNSQISNCQKRNIEQNSSQTFISSPDVVLSKSSMSSGNVDSSHLKSLNPLNVDYPQTKNSSITPDRSHQNTTYIRRSSKKIDWSSTTSDVVSTKSPVNTPQIQKSESKMKWFLQPIDFNVTSPVGNTKSVDTICTNNVSTPGDFEKQLKFDTPVNSSTPNKASQKSAGIVIVSRKRPAKFGVSEISVQCSLKVNET